MQSLPVNSSRVLPELVLAYYGDDLTGSTAVMECLAVAGLPTVLFTCPPTEALLRRYQGVRAVGVAGVSRSLTRPQMERVLPGAFEALANLQPSIVHYKVCSTFDTSLHVGSIGKALEIGRSVFGEFPVPIVAGAPALGRYCIFGNLFAKSGGEGTVYRLDRHPTMSRHPTTPMHESDLRLVLAEETDLKIGLVDLEMMAKPDALVKLVAEVKEERLSAVVFDVLSGQNLEAVGSILWEDFVGTKCDSHSQTEMTPAFVIGSTGIEDALCAYWGKAGLLQGTQMPQCVDPVEQILCISGSCSPVTAGQISYALECGFVELAIDPTQLLDSYDQDAWVASVREEALSLLKTSKSLIVHTSRGPEDSRLEAFNRCKIRSGIERGAAEIIGPVLGSLLQEALQHSNIRRVVVAGGDTSGYVLQQLGIEALEYVGALASGAPLCSALCHDGVQFEICLKGGQIGKEDFFVSAREGSQNPD